MIIAFASYPEAMQTEVMVALIGAGATIVAALLGLWGTKREGRVFAPVMIGVLTLAILGGLGFWAYRSAQEPTHNGDNNAGNSASKNVEESKAAVTYPTTNNAYAEELLLAWARTDKARMAQLTTASAMTQLSAIPGSPNPAWKNKSCGRDCVYLNDDGDVITFSIDSGTVGKAQAVTRVQFDKTVFPNEGEAYVRAFIEAWRNDNLPRQRRLATDNALKQLGGLKAPQDYKLSTDGAMGHLYIKADSGGLSITFDVSNQLSAQARPQAIIDIRIA